MDEKLSTSFNGHEQTDMHVKLLENVYKEDHFGNSTDYFRGLTVSANHLLDIQQTTS